MTVATAAVLSLVGISPLLVFFNGYFIDGLFEFYAAIVLATIAVSIRPGEAAHWFRTLRWTVLLAVLPLLWLVTQLLPLPSSGLAASLWQSAIAALPGSTWASLSIDPGLTVLTMIRYLAFFCVFGAAGAISGDRQQAERLFSFLTAASVAIAAISIVLQVTHFALEAQAGALAASAFGVILTTGLTIMTVERHSTRRASQDLLRGFLLPLILALSGFIICVLSIVLSGLPYAAVAAGCGFTAIAIIQFVRRIGLDWKAGAAMAAIASAGAAIVVASKGAPVAADLSMRYSARASEETIGVADRILNQIGWAGSGGGTFDAIWSLFSPNGVVSAPTSAAQAAIEIGRPVFWIGVVSVVAVILVCGRGAFQRGRDFFYASAGAGLGVAALVLAFCDVGLNGLAVQILLACTIGLALAQSSRRTI